MRVGEVAHHLADQSSGRARAETCELLVAAEPEDDQEPDGLVVRDGCVQVGQVRMSCYTAEYAGTLAPSSEIDELAWFCYADRDRVPPVDQLLFDDLNAAGQLR